MENQSNITTYMVDLDRIRSYIRQLMAENHVTVAKLAEKTGIAKGTLDNFFDGSTKAPTFDKVCTLIIVLGGSVDEAIGIAKKEEQQKNQIVGLEHITAAHKEVVDSKREIISELKAELIEERRKSAAISKWQVAVAIESVIFTAAIMLLMLH